MRQSTSRNERKRIQIDASLTHIKSFPQRLKLPPTTSWFQMINKKIYYQAIKLCFQMGRTRSFFFIANELRPIQILFPMFPQTTQNRTTHISKEIKRNRNPLQLSLPSDKTYSLKISLRAARPIFCDTIKGGTYLLLQVRQGNRAVKCPFVLTLLC